jgi:hypothetical protein
MTTWGLLESPGARPKEIRETLIQVLQKEFSTLLRQKTRREGDEVKVTFERAVANILIIFRKA